MQKQFSAFLAKQELSPNTVSSYLWTVEYFQRNYQTLNKENLQAYKGYLMEHFKPQTVNLRLQAINKFLEFQKKEQLKKDNYQDWYFVVWFLGATGARVSELTQIKAEHIALGYLDLYTKGGKIRRLYIPKKLRNEAQKWLKEKGIFSGYIFLNKFGNKITTRGIAGQLKYFAEKYELNPKMVYPHSFRHRFAKNFLEKFNDIAFLADLMGHESIETTRIYLRRTATEQQQIVDKIVTW